MGANRLLFQKIFCTASSNQQSNNHGSDLTSYVQHVPETDYVSPSNCRTESNYGTGDNENDFNNYIQHVPGMDYVCPNNRKEEINCRDLGCAFPLGCQHASKIPPNVDPQNDGNVIPCGNVNHSPFGGHSCSTKAHDCVWTNNNNINEHFPSVSTTKTTENLVQTDGSTLGYKNPSYRHEEDERTDLHERNVDLDQLQRNLEDLQKLKQPYETRKFYRRQSELLQSYQDVDTVADDKIKRYNSLQKKVNLYAKISFGANVLLLICKSTAAVLSGSMAIITSLVDSVVDLASGVVVWWTNNKVRRTDPRKYPRGRRRMESLAVIILSVIMGVASLYMIKEASVKVVALAEETRGPPTVDYVTIGISIFTIVIKLLLYLLCRRVSSPTVQALAQDHRNDVFSNTLAIACGYVGSQQVLERFRYRSLIYIDPVGAILISLYIAVTWYRTGCEQSDNIVGKTARHQTISKVMWLCINFDNRILSVADIFVYHSGFYHIAEVELCLPAEMNVMEFMDLSKALKQKLESMEGVELAYVTASPTSMFQKRI